MTDYISTGTIDDRTTEEVVDSLRELIWQFLDDCYDLDAHTVAKIAHQAAIQTRIEMKRIGKRN